MRRAYAAALMAMVLAAEGRNSNQFIVKGQKQVAVKIDGKERTGKMTFSYDVTGIVRVEFDGEEYDARLTRYPTSNGKRLHMFLHKQGDLSTLEMFRTYLKTGIQDGFVFSRFEEFRERKGDFLDSITTVVRGTSISSVEEREIRNVRDVDQSFGIETLEALVKHPVWNDVLAAQAKHQRNAGEWWKRLELLNPSRYILSESEGLYTLVTRDAPYWLVKSYKGERVDLFMVNRLANGTVRYSIHANSWDDKPYMVRINGLLLVLDGQVEANQVGYTRKQLEEIFSFGYDQMLRARRLLGPKLGETSIELPKENSSRDK